MKSLIEEYNLIFWISIFLSVIGILLDHVMTINAAYLLMLFSHIFHRVRHDDMKSSKEKYKNDLDRFRKIYRELELQGGR